MATIASMKKPAPKKRAPRMFSVVKASSLIASSVNPTAAREAVLTRMIAGKLTVVAREGFYRKSSGDLQPLEKPLLVDGRLWKRIEDGHQQEAFWSNGSVQLAKGPNSPPLDLADLQIEKRGFDAIIASVRRAGTGSLAGAQTCRHAEAIDFLIRYLRALREKDEARFHALKQTTVQEMLTESYKKVGGRLLGARGLKDISAEIHRLARNERVDEKLAAKFAQLAGISARDP
jgi:hypothetical protein